MIPAWAYQWTVSISQETSYCKISQNRQSFPIALAFDRRPGSVGAETPAQLQNDMNNLTILTVRDFTGT